MPEQVTVEVRVCIHCGRDIELIDGRWVDPEATGDDSVWRETCDAHDTFEADHEPELTFSELGAILLREAGETACRDGYKTTDPEWVGRYGLEYGDINRDGTLN